MNLLSVLMMSMAITAQDGFREKYSALDSLQNINRLVYNGAVRPIWTNESTFIYRTYESSGEAYYLVDASKTSRKALSKSEYDSLSKSLNTGSTRERRGKTTEFPSPDNSRTAIIRDNNIWIRDAESERQVTFDGTDQYSYYVIHWSPDSEKIAAFRREYVKERQIPLRRSAPENAVQPELKWIDYAKPGDRLPQEMPVLINAVTGEKKDIEGFTDQYFVNFGKWSKDSEYFTFEYNRRGHQVYSLVAVNGQDGSTRLLADETSDTFIYYYNLYRHYMDNGDILWVSERDDWRHFYRIDGKTGATEQLTKGAWNVRDILRIDEEKGAIYFTANGMNAIDESGNGTPEGEDPYNKHLLKLNLNTLEISDLTPENANHLIYMNPQKTMFVDVMSRPDMPPVSVLRNMDGRTIMEIQRADISALESTGWTMPEVFVADGRDGKTDIWGTIFRPSDYNPRKKYPVVEYIYAGPHDSFVLKDFYAYTRFSKLLELGFIVVTIDGMGTDNRSKSFQDVCWRNLKDSGYPDRILWIKKAAARYRSMDISNMGVYGYSAGGQSTMAALLFFGDFYKVGVSLCGCHDNRMDKIWWNEQWMGYPIGPWYSENSNVDNAHRLEGKLLLINGELDDNVDPASTLQVVNALIKADKDFEQLYLPGYTHSLGDDYVTRKVFEFFYKNIK